MTAVVLDSSAALTWCFEDEVTAETEALLERVRTGGAVVPRLWHLEIVNALLVGERRGRLQFGRTATLLGLLASLPIVTDDETGGRAFGDALHLARRGRNPTAGNVFGVIAELQKATGMTLQVRPAR